MTPTTSHATREKAGAPPTASPRGRFIWYELLANDESVAARFYTNVLGWSTELFKRPVGQPPYTMWTTGGKAFGGLMTLPEDARVGGAPSHWLGYVAVPDTDASLAQATRRGARIHLEPMDLPEVGRIAVIGDPQGAAPALFTPTTSQAQPNEPPPEGIVSWHELATDDWKNAWDFYQDLFGWQKGEAMDMGAMGTYQIFTIDGVPSGAMFDRPPQIPVSNWLYYFRVPDLDRTVETIKAGGGEILNGPMDVPGGRIAQAMDPQGAAFAVHWIQ